MVALKSRNLFDRLETSTSFTADDVVTFESCKRKLRQLGMDDDQTILEALQGAVNEAENHCNRTFRQSVSGTAYYRGWTRRFYLPHPPAISVTSVKYYDPDDTLQTVSSADYTLLTSNRGPGRVEFQDDYTFANLNDDRETPVEIVFVRGFSTADEVPPLVKSCIRVLCEADFDNDQSLRKEALARLQHFVYRGLP